MNTECYIGIDFSISCPCVCVRTPNDVAWAFVMEHLSGKWESRIDSWLLKRVTALEPGAGIVRNSVDRYRNISLPLMNWLLDTVPSISTAKIAIEGYSMHSIGKVFNIAENTGVFKYLLSVSGGVYNEVAPTAIKKFATGSGRAEKQQMISAFNKEYGRDLIDLSQMKTAMSPYADIVDSYFMSKWAQFQESSDMVSED